MQRNEQATCQTCPYFHERRDTGQCHIHPPTDRNEDRSEGFPMVDVDDWCGEHPDFAVIGTPGGIAGPSEGSGGDRPA